MNPLLLLIGLSTATPDAAPASVVVATSRGVEVLPVATHLGHPALPADGLEKVLPITASVDDGWAEVTFARQLFRFPLGAPFFVFRNEVRPLVGGAYVLDDSLFVPLQWLAGEVPRVFTENFRYDAVAGRFEEVSLTPVMTRVSPPGRTVPPAAAKLGLRLPHKVVIDPGHGGTDPGTAGRYFPRGIQEKQVVLAIAKDVERELKKHGVDVELTRRTDVLVPFRTRARMCSRDCDAFISIHVNSLRDSRSNRRIRGVETYFWREALTAEAARVAAMENESLRYEEGLPVEGDDDPLAFILKDLERNEYLRESADLADMVHTSVSDSHPAGSRRMAQADFVVLREAIRPAILVETGYGSNPDDGRFLASEAGQQRLARAIADGIIEYLLRYEDRTISAPPSR